LSGPACGWLIRPPGCLPRACHRTRWRAAPGHPEPGRSEQSKRDARGRPAAGPAVLIRLSSRSVRRRRMPSPPCGRAAGRQWSRRTLSCDDPSQGAAATAAA
jgi:hypothetical protein